MPQDLLEEIYMRLFSAFGPQDWWPGDTRFEIVVGAILTQNTNWSNVELALSNLKRSDLLDPLKMYHLPQDQLAKLIRPAGYFNVKARRLHNFLEYLVEQYECDFDRMAEVSLSVLRAELLAVNGIGPETADSILLYVFNQPIFVVDTYTKRFLYRHGIVEQHAKYEFVQNVFMSALQLDVKYFNEYHALIVKLGKDYCKPNPRCEECPLNACQYSLQYRCKSCYRHLSDPSQRALVGDYFSCHSCL